MKGTPQIMAEKYRVTMRSVVAMANGEVATHEVNDYVPLDILDAYVSSAKVRWQVVEVSEEPDSGPGGDDGHTVIPDELS